MNAASRFRKRNRLCSLATSAEALLTATSDYSIEKMIDGFEAAIRFANARRGKLL